MDRLDPAPFALSRPGSLRAWVWVAFVVAVAAPTLLALNAPPSSTFFNQAVALAGWGACGLLLGLHRRVADNAARDGVRAASAALALLGGAAVAAMALQASPAGLAGSSLGFVLAGLLVLHTGFAESADTGRGAAFRAFAEVLVVAALLSVVVALVQYFLPALADGDVIARANGGGRVGANLRQPNHLSSLLLAALAAAVWWRETASAAVQDGRGARWALAAVLLVLAAGVVLTVSRTGVVCIGLLVLWGVLDRTLTPFTRRLLWLLPVAFVALWLALDAWSTAQSTAFAGADQLHKSDLSSSRFGIWSNTLDLIRANPWTGVGWGEFNFAWTLTPFPGRPVAFFDHTHNLPLQLLVELGIPLGALVMALLLYALWVACRKAVRVVPEDRAAARASFVMVLMMGVHSLLEYPLWYAYFLLPTAFAFGIVLGAREVGPAPAAAATSRPAATPDWTRSILVGCSALLVAGAAYSVVDYFKVVRIFAPGDDAAPLEARIAEGRGSLFFAHHAEYAAVTTAARPSDEMRGFAVATHYLLDARLMVAWSKALAEAGDLERARYVAQRLKEFRHALGDAFFAPCADAAVVDKPFQCTPPTRSFTFRDFRGGR